MTTDDADSAPRHTNASSASELAALQQSVEADRLRLARLEEQVGNRELHTRAVSRVLPQAIAIRSRQDRALVDALEPTVESALRATVRDDPQLLADALYPIMGPAIRKTIFNALNVMLQRLNRAREQSLTIRSFAWRLEALRTGRTFAEVMLMKSIVFRVEQVFLIHKKTGLLLQHVVARGVVVKDTQIVSGMLSAIQDFVRDSFSTAGGDTLQLLRVGEITVALEQGPLAIVAVVVRGVPPAELRAPLQSVVEKIHAEVSEELVWFQGDTAPFVVVRSLLDSCLIEKRREMQRRRISISKVVCLLALTAVALLVLRYFVGLAIVRGERNRLVAAFEREPGYALLSTRIDLVDRIVHLHAMRDPLARDWRAVMNQAEVDPVRVVAHWTLFESLDPAVLLARAKDVLAPPPTVELTLEDGGILRARGTAPHRWTSRASTIAVAMPGIREFDAKELADPLLEEARRLKRELEEYVYSLATPKPRRMADDTSADIFDLVKQLDQVALEAGLFVRLRVIVTARDITSEEEKRARGQVLCSEVDALKMSRVQCSVVVNPETAGPPGHINSPQASANFAVDLIEADSVLEAKR